MRINIPVITNKEIPFQYLGTCKDTEYFADELASANMIKASSFVKPSILQYCKLDIIPRRVQKVLNEKYEEDYTLMVSEQNTILTLYDIRKDVHYFWVSKTPIQIIGHLDLGILLDRGVDKFLEHGEH